MSVTQINAELQILAQEQLDLVVEDRYNDMMDELCAFHDMMMYASHSYDQDAEAYGYQ